MDTSSPPTAPRRSDSSSSCGSASESDGPPLSNHGVRKERIYKTRHDLDAFLLLDDQPIWVFDIVRKAMWFANDAALALWAAPTLESLLARDFKDMSESTENRLDRYRVQFSRERSPEEPPVRIHEQWTFYPNGDTPKTCWITARGICIEEGRIAMICHGVEHRETPENKAEQEALRSVEMLRHLPVAVCMTDLEGNIMEQNPEAVAVFGSVVDNSKTGDSGRGECGESTFIQRFEDKALGHRILEQARAGTDVLRLEALQHTVHGPRWEALQVRQTKDPVTSKPVLLYSARDITAVVEAKRNAVEANVAKMDLVTDLAHAIRTPLQHVVGVVELISRQQQQPEDERGTKDAQFFNLLQSAAQLLMTVIHDLMESVGTANVTFNKTKDTSCNTNHLQRSSSGMGIDRPPSYYQPRNYDSNQQDRPHGRARTNNHILLEHAPFDIRNVLDNIVVTLTPHANLKHLSLKVRTHRKSTTGCNTPVSVMGDANRLGQVLFQILHNAVKYTSKGGVTVVVRKTQSRSRRIRIRFEVRDTGVGMNLEQQRQCMWMKNNDTNHNNDQASSSGVGLVLCRSIVEAMGGTIGVESKPGRGTTVWFEIPFLRASGAVGPTAGGCSEAKHCKNVPKKKSLLAPVPDDGGLHILLVDEDNVGRNITVALLEQAGHTVATADNGDKMMHAITSQDGESYDVVLLETEVPASKRTALAAVQEIRKIGYSAETLPIIALTAAVPRGDYPELGLNDWLTKPTRLKQVETAMTNAICNVGASSVGTGSIMYDLESQCSGHTDSCNGLTFASPYGDQLLGVSNNNDSSPVLPRRGSFNSIQSANFSECLQAIMGSSINTGPTRASTPDCNAEEVMTLG